jgi:VanZ family protein
MMKLVQAMAILIAAVLLVLTVVPAAERPETGLQHDFEHFAAFALAGLLFGAAFRIQTGWLLIAGAVYTLLLECLQIPLPTRHARLEDLMVDCLAICLGIVLVRVGRSCALRFQSSANRW